MDNRENTATTEKPTILEQLRTLNRLFQGKIEIKDLADLPLKILTLAEFQKAYWLILMSKKKCAALALMRPELQFGSYEGFPALICYPNDKNPFGFIAVLDEDLSPNKIDDYRFRCSRLFLMNERRQTVPLQSFLPAGIGLNFFLANATWKNEKAEAEDEAIGHKFAFELKSKKVRLGEIHRSNHLDWALHEIGHSWCFDQNIDPFSRDQTKLRSDSMHLIEPTAKRLFFRHLKRPLTGVVQEMMTSERLASIIARVLRAILEKNNFTAHAGNLPLEEAIQSYDSYISRYVLENFPNQAKEFFASRWSRSTKGLEQNREILRMTSDLERSTLKRIQELGKPTSTRKNIFTGKAVETWEKQNNSGDFLVDVTRTINGLFISANISWMGREKDQPWIIVRIGSIYGAAISQGMGRDIEMLNRVVAGVKNPDYAEVMKKVETQVDLVLSQFV